MAENAPEPTDDGLPAQPSNRRKSKPVSKKDQKTARDRYRVRHQPGAARRPLGTIGQVGTSGPDRNKPIVTIDQVVEMRRRDGQAKALIQLVLLPLRKALQTGTFVEPDNGDATEETDFLNQMWTLPPVAGGMTVSKNRAISQMLLSVTDGFAPFEIVRQIPEDGPLKGKITLRKLAYRDPRTVKFRSTRPAATTASAGQHRRRGQRGRRHPRADQDADHHAEPRAEPALRGEPVRGGLAAFRCQAEVVLHRAPGRAVLRSPRAHRQDSPRRQARPRSTPSASPSRTSRSTPPW
jgi:hypothetical protein